MADVAVPLTSLSADTASADIVGSGTAITNGQTFDIDVKNRTDEICILIEETASSTATVTFDAGDNPPSLRAGLGALDVSLAADDIKALVLSGGRYIHTNGKIEGSVSGAVRMRVLDLPRTW